MNILLIQFLDEEGTNSMHGIPEEKNFQQPAMCASGFV